MLRRFPIFDYANNGTYVETKEKPIDFILVQVLSGDETGTIYYKDGTKQDFDSCDRRIYDYIDYSYTLRGAMIDKWVKYQPPFPKHFLSRSYLRATEFSQEEDE